MTIYLDSASAEDALRAADLGFVRGVTTNPTLLASTGRTPDEVVPELADIISGLVFHQLSEPTPEARDREARAMLAARPGRIGLKIPCTLDNLALAARLASEDQIVGITAVFDPSQVVLAIEAGARFVLPYVNRSTRLQGDGIGLVAEMRQTIDAVGAPTEIIAASIKSPREAIDTLLAGAHHLTLPLEVIEAMAHHELSRQAIQAFGANP
jgi:transaldolase